MIRWFATPSGRVSYRGSKPPRRVGASQMVIHSPYTTWDHNNLDLYPGNREAAIERVQATLSDVIRRAELIGCELVIENIEDKDPHERVHLAKALGSKNVRVSLDTGHAHYAHISTGAPPVDYYVDAAGDMLTHVHLQDFGRLCRPALGAGRRDHALGRDLPCARPAQVESAPHPRVA